jgi:hypothetical protein
MIVSSKVDLVCWTGRVGLVCRDCREALTTGDAGGGRRTSNAQRSRGPRDAVPSEIYVNYRGTHAGPFNDLRQRHIFGPPRLPLWVKQRSPEVQPGSRLCFQERTSSVWPLRSEKCQYATSPRRAKSNELLHAPIVPLLLVAPNAFDYTPTARTVCRLRHHVDARARRNGEDEGPRLRRQKSSRTIAVDHRVEE